MGSSGAWSFLWVHPCPSLPQQWCLASRVGWPFSWIPSALAFLSSACAAQLLSPSGCPHMPASVLSPGLPLEPESQHPAPVCASLAGVSRPVVQMQLSLCFAFLSPAAVLFVVTLRFLHLSLSPCQLAAFPGGGILFSFRAPSQEC